MLGPTRYVRSVSFLPFAKLAARKIVRQRTHTRAARRRARAATRAATNRHPKPRPRAQTPVTQVRGHKLESVTQNVLEKSLRVEGNVSTWMLPMSFLQRVSESKNDGGNGLAKLGSLASTTVNCSVSDISLNCTLQDITHVTELFSGADSAGQDQDAAGLDKDKSREQRNSCGSPGLGS